MRRPTDHVNDLFAASVKTFAAELDQRARDRFPEVVNQALAAHGLARDQLSPREQAFADALVAALLQVTGEIVGLALRRSFDLVTQTLEEARLAFPEGG